ncbi:hypothetical protein [Chryseobacterium daeguense]|uniref:hypothetical protein n=1 Tax=Chryseobacterium daeguense TaxID=412438 RepID=UPI000486D2C9|nr:hypothetical protein [Chryseobacterium daeguense]
MKKKLLFPICFLYAISAHSQIGIHTGNPQGMFHVDAAKDNPATGAPTAAQQANDFIVTSPNGYVGVGTTTPARKLHIVGDGVNDPVQIGGLVAGDAQQDILLGVTSTGIIRTLSSIEALSIPRPALFALGSDVNNFLNGVAPGTNQIVPMSVIKNQIPGLTFDNTIRQITLPAGTYEFSFVYEATHNNTGCTISSYFVDFPNDGTAVRVQSNASHLEGGASNHGGSINYSAKLVNPTNTFNIRLGRGQGGNCTGTGMTLFQNSTHLLIYRMGA